MPTAPIRNKWTNEWKVSRVEEGEWGEARGEWEQNEGLNIIKTSSIHRLISQVNPYIMCNYNNLIKKITEDWIVMDKALTYTSLSVTCLGRHGGSCWCRTSEQPQALGDDLSMPSADMRSRAANHSVYVIDGTPKWVQMDASRTWVVNRNEKAKMVEWPVTSTSYLLLKFTSSMESMDWRLQRKSCETHDLNILRLRIFVMKFM